MQSLALCLKYCPDKMPFVPTVKVGDGADGEVFDVPHNPKQIIKIGVLYEYLFLDEDINLKYQNINQVLSYLIQYRSPGYAHVYESVYLDTKYRSTVAGQQKFILYYYIMEKLKKISEDERKVFHSILSHEDSNLEKNYSEQQVREMLEGLRRGLDFDMERVIIFHNALQDVPILHYDIHVRNIMKDDIGNFKLIDFDRCKLK